ncbi:anthrone oxygenase family protein [Streptomyces sp. NPDC001709]
MNSDEEHAITAVLKVLALLGSGITAGVLFCVALSVVPMFLRLSWPRYVEVHRLLGRNFDPAMPLTVLSSAVLDAALAAVGPQGVQRALFGAAGALLIGVSAVSHLANVPINRAVKAPGSDERLPGRSDPRPRWRAWNLLRTCCAVGALAANATAAVISR